MKKVLVISPGVLPVPPVMGGAVENMIARLHGEIGDTIEGHYISVSPPPEFRRADPRFDNAVIHELGSINPLSDFTPDNHFELQESAKWSDYTQFCFDVASRLSPDIIHIHNEVRLSAVVKSAAPNAHVIVHVNDEVVTRLDGKGLQEVSDSVDLLLSCSDYIAGQIRSNFEAHRIRPPIMQTFYNFVNPDEFDPARIDAERVSALRGRYGLNSSGVIGFVGRMIEQKGPQTVIRAFRSVLRNGFDAQLLFVGAPWYSRDEATPWMEFLKREVADFKDRVVFTGYIPHDEIPAHYALTDIMTIPSIWDDPSPFVAYESQAMARPVLGSMRGGIPEIIGDRQSGRTIDVYNTPLFTDILSTWLQDPDGAGKLGSAGRQRVSSTFSLDKAANQLREIYAQW